MNSDFIRFIWERYGYNLNIPLVHKLTLPSNCAHLQMFYFARIGTKKCYFDFSQNKYERN